DDRRNRLQMSMISALSGAVAAGMCVLNAVRGETVVLLVALMFSIISFINVAIVSYNTRTLTVSYWLFSLNLVVLSTYLLVFDGTAFGALWLCAVPAFSPLLLGRMRGFCLSAVVLAILLFLLWTPWGGALLQTSYVQDFSLQLSLVYITFFVAGYWFEFVRATTAGQLKDLQKRFREMSIRDTLTGLYNRHWISLEMPLIMKRCSGQTRLAVMILDIDYFKKLNDSHGHLYGDAVLKKMAELLSQIVEPVGYVCRWGGEEFAVLAEGLDEEQTTELAQQLRQSIEEMEVPDENGTSQTVTISVGAVSMMPTADMRPDYLINCADNALYAAKNAGRNAVHYYAGAWYYRDFEDDAASAM
ncbi:MAG: GGDEF domain-containing protein, partial [Clostridia bacterium]|nr:GGDEF domain-containing protein [Clostridia bacterium]